MSRALYHTLGVFRHVGSSNIKTTAWSQPSILSIGKCLSCSGSSRWYSRFSNRMNSPLKLERKEESHEPQQLSPDNAGNDLDSGLVFSHQRHNMYVCWHPEVPHPYEMTKPIDLAAPATESNLKIQSLTPVREGFRKKDDKVIIQELIKLTYATKHRFFGPYGKRKRVVLREMDPNKQKRNREYL